MSRRPSAVRLAAAIGRASQSVDQRTLAGRVVDLLVAQRAVRLWPRIAAAMRRQNLAERGLAPLTVTVAQPLAADVLARLGRAASHAALAVDPSLIGGAVVRYGDVQIDRSVRGRLAELRHRLSPNR